MRLAREWPQKRHACPFGSLGGRWWTVGLWRGIGDRVVGFGSTTSAIVFRISRPVLPLPTHGAAAFKRDRSGSCDSVGAHVS
jgi:hypothetical protein